MNEDFFLFTLYFKYDIFFSFLKEKKQRIKLKLYKVIKIKNILEVYIKNVVILITIPYSIKKERI